MERFTNFLFGFILFLVLAFTIGAILINVIPHSRGANGAWFAPDFGFIIIGIPLISIFTAIPGAILITRYFFKKDNSIAESDKSIVLDKMEVIPSNQKSTGFNPFILVTFIVLISAIVWLCFFYFKLDKLLGFRIENVFGILPILIIVLAVVITRMITKKRKK